MASSAPATPSPASCGVPRWPDDGRVDEQEQRLGDQRAEGRDGEPEDLPVLDPAAGPAGCGSPGSRGCPDVGHTGPHRRQAAKFLRSTGGGSATAHPAGRPAGSLGRAVHRAVHSSIPRSSPLGPHLRRASSTSCPQAIRPVAGPPVASPRFTRGFCPTSLSRWDAGPGPRGARGVSGTVSVPSSPASPRRVSWAARRRRTSPPSSACSAACCCPRTPSPTSSRWSAATTSTGPPTSWSSTRSSTSTAAASRPTPSPSPPSCRSAASSAGSAARPTSTPCCSRCPPRPTPATTPGSSARRPSCAG